VTVPICRTSTRRIIIKAGEQSNCRPDTFTQTACSQLRVLLQSGGGPYIAQVIRVGSFGSRLLAKSDITRAPNCSDCGLPTCPITPRKDPLLNLSYCCSADCAVHLPTNTRFRAGGSPTARKSRRLPKRRTRTKPIKHLPAKLRQYEMCMSWYQANAGGRALQSRTNGWNRHFHM
jgi:hypothetical protein